MDGFFLPPSRAKRLPMSDPAGRSPDPALAAQGKRNNRNATIAGFVTLAVVILLVFQVGNDTLKSYSFFVGVVPALIVYFFVATRGSKGPKT